jgi:multidrug transporter EmrE-like cation transporter
MAWIWLTVAGLLRVYFLALAVRTIPIGTGYAGIAGLKLI